MDDVLVDGEVTAGSPIPRSRIVCQRCHDKKTRCNMQRTEGKCTSCIKAGVSCIFRPSRKGQHLRRHDREDRGPSIQVSRPAWVEGQADQIRSEVPLTTDYIRALLGHQARLHLSGSDDDDGAVQAHQHAPDDFLPGMMRTYLETYSEFYFTWCPIIDIEDSSLTAGSSLMDHAIAAVSGLVKPMLITGTSRHEEHYERARYLFYCDRRPHSLALIKAAMILCCYDTSSLRCPTDSGFWWLGAAIRLAQDMRLHRAARSSVLAPDAGLHRRIWWTLFARERIAALCQGRPCSIAEEDCTLGRVQLIDFPVAHDRQARIFIHWVDLCRIMGLVQKQMLSARENRQAFSMQEMAIMLLSWLDSLPQDLRLSIADAHTAPFSRDVHILHLPYLTTIALICQIGMGDDSFPIPGGAPMAAACTARIARDLLLRGLAHTLPEDCGWYVSIAIVALLHVPPSTWFAGQVEDELRVLRATLEQLGKTFSSSRLLAAGLDKLLNDRSRAAAAGHESIRSSVHQLPTPQSVFSLQTREESQGRGTPDEFSWPMLLRSASADTNPLMAALLVDGSKPPSDEPWDTTGDQFKSLWDDLVADEVRVSGEFY